MVEKELMGPVYRATLVGRRLAAVLRRDPPHVVGDGQHTVRELAAEENKNPLRRGPVFANINVDSLESARELAWQRKTLDSVPAKGEAAFFHFKVNWGVGGTSRDATDETHPGNVKLFEAIGEYLGDDIAGLDFMIPDIKKSWREQKCGIIECNSLPLIGNHHFPYTGKVVNVAAKVWDMIFPDSSK
jgi:cyanophycin synthetase